MARKKTITITLIQFSGKGLAQKDQIQEGTILSALLRQYEPSGFLGSVVRVNGVEVPEDTVLEDGDRVVTSPRDIVAERQFKIAGRIWRVHLNDTDAIHPTLHAHDVESGEQLDLRNGRRYRGREEVKRLDKKTLLLVRHAMRDLKLPPLDLD
ncbi:MAG TPA: hypothetical protein PLC99_19975 [Verrucomicrobiota bacterium]|nr:hypothetical protein [Verrucomicrobiota bacterium]